MMLFKNEEMIDYLNSLQVSKSVHEYVEYDSEIEREFARRLDERDDIKLFVRLPRKFEIDTPVGKYNSDWAIVKQESETIYLVRETKSTQIDVIDILVGGDRPRKYWNDLKKKLLQEGYDQLPHFFYFLFHNSAVDRFQANRNVMVNFVPAPTWLSTNIGA